MGAARSTAADAGLRFQEATKALDARIGALLNRPGRACTDRARRRERVMGAFDRVVEGDDTERRVKRMTERMRELGIPESELEIWGA